VSRKCQAGYWVVELRREQREHIGNGGLLRAIVVTHSYLAALDPVHLSRSPSYS